MTASGSEESAGGFHRLPRPTTSIEICEVGPRDGLQNELRTLSAAAKVQLIEALAASGVRRIEVTSFVSPRWVPQLADAEKVMEQLPRRSGIQYAALVPNLKGLDRAKAAGVTEVAVFLSVTESHSQKNTNKSVREGIEAAREVTAAARSARMQVRCYLSTVWGCPYEGKTPVQQVVEVMKQLADLDVVEFSLGDTIGVGTPYQTEDILLEVSRVIPVSRLALHLHDTRGTALANALVGIGAGVTHFDSSIGGLGGCPYAPGAAGNLATEDLVYMLQGMGIETGIDWPKLVAAGALAQDLIGRRLPGKCLQAALAERDRALKRKRGYI